jgi:hypothetical protein
MRASPKQAWPHGADPCLGTGFRQRVTTAAAGREEMFFSREQAGACEGPSAVSEGLSAVPNRLASLKSKTGGTIPPRSAIRNLRICSKFFSAAIRVDVCNQNLSTTKRSTVDVMFAPHRGADAVFNARSAAPSAVTTATLTHLMGPAAPAPRQGAPAPRQRSAHGPHPNIVVVARWRSSVWATACARVANPGLFFEVAVPRNAKRVKSSGLPLPLARGADHQRPSSPVQSTETAHRDFPAPAPSSTPSLRRHTGRRIAAKR